MKALAKSIPVIAAIVVVALVGYGCAATPEQSTQVATSTPVPNATWTPAPTPPSAADPTPTPAKDMDGLVLTWTREGGIAGFCDAVAVYGDGQVEVSWCRGNELRESKSLSAGQRAQLLAWVETYAAYEYEHRDQAVADGMRVRLTFAGQGKQKVPDAERQAMLDWASTLVPSRAAATPPGASPVYMLSSGVSVEYALGWEPSPGGYDGTQESVWFASPDAEVAPVGVEVYHRPLSGHGIADPNTWQSNEGDCELHWTRPITTAGGLSGSELVWGAYSEPQEQWGTSSPQKPTAASPAEPAPFVDNVSLQEPLSERFLLVDQASQRMYVFENGVPVRQLPVSTGRPTSVTLTRAWKGTVGRDLGSGGVDGGMLADFKWFLFQDLYGSILIHSVPYTRQDDVKVYDQLDALGLRPASRGCVRISPEDAQWLKAWNPVGVLIEITAWPGRIEQVTGNKREE